MSDILATLLDEMGGVHPLPKTRPEVEEVLTPSGVVIRYEDKRHYYWINDQRVASVSSVLGVLDKPALVWWGMKIGVEGVLSLIGSEELFFRDHIKPNALITNEPAEATVQDVVDLLTFHKLTVNHVRDKAGERGTTVHDALELWASTGAMPSPVVYPDEQAGYVTGLAAFLKEAVIEPEATETIVGSLEYGFAGRYDLRCRINGSPAILDLKTSGKVYPEHFLQLEAYEGASLECGYEETDKRLVLRVDRDGSYELRESPATYTDFLAVLGCFKATASLKQRLKAAV